jgi:2-dehydropantoate 2-reductase
VCIVGAGAIGGLLAVRLAAAGQSVRILARNENLTAIRANGVRLVEPDGTVLVAPMLEVSDDVSQLGLQDVVILSVKAHQIAQIATQLPALYHDDTVVIPMQNGVPWWFFQHFAGPFAGYRIHALDPDGTLERSIPPDRILASIAYPAAQREGPGVVRLVEGDRFPVGELNGKRSERALQIATLLTNAGFTSRVLTDVRSHIWVKAWGNLALNPISALTGATLAQICRWPLTRDLAGQMMAEAAGIAEKLGLHLRLSIEQRIAAAERVGDHRTSMLQDVEEGRPLEVEPLIGAFVELGELTHTAMPATRSVYALVSLLNSRLGQSEPH